MKSVKFILVLSVILLQMICVPSYLQLNQKITINKANSKEEIGKRYPVILTYLKTVIENRQTYYLYKDEFGAILKLNKKLSEKDKIFRIHQKGFPDKFVFSNTGQETSFVNKTVSEELAKYQVGKWYEAKLTYVKAEKIEGKRYYIYNDQFGITVKFPAKLTNLDKVYWYKTKEGDIKYIKNGDGGMTTRRDSKARRIPCPIQFINSEMRDGKKFYLYKAKGDWIISFPYKLNRHHKVTCSPSKDNMQTWIEYAVMTDDVAAKIPVKKRVLVKLFFLRVDEVNGESKYMYVDEFGHRLYTNNSLGNADEVYLQKDEKGRVSHTWVSVKTTGDCCTFRYLKSISTNQGQLYVYTTSDYGADAHLPRKARTLYMYLKTNWGGKWKITPEDVPRYFFQAYNIIDDLYLTTAHYIKSEISLTGAKYNLYTDKFGFHFWAIFNIGRNDKLYFYRDKYGNLLYILNPGQNEQYPTNAYTLLTYAKTMDINGKIYVYRTKDGDLIYSRKYYGYLWKVTKEEIWKLLTTREKILHSQHVKLVFLKEINSNGRKVYLYKEADGTIVNSNTFYGKTWNKVYYRKDDTTAARSKSVTSIGKSSAAYIYLTHVKTIKNNNNEYIYVYQTRDGRYVKSKVNQGKTWKVIAQQAEELIKMSRSSESKTVELAYVKTIMNKDGSLSYLYQTRNGRYVKSKVNQGKTWMVTARQAEELIKMSRSSESKTVKLAYVKTIMNKDGSLSYVYQARDGRYVKSKVNQGKTWMVTARQAEELIKMSRTSESKTVELTYVKTIMNKDGSLSYLYQTRNGRYVKSKVNQGKTWMVTARQAEELIKMSRSSESKTVELAYVKTIMNKDGNLSYLYQTRNGRYAKSKVNQGKTWMVTAQQAEELIARSEVDESNYTTLTFDRTITGILGNKIYIYRAKPNKVYHLNKYHGRVWKATSSELVEAHGHGRSELNSNVILLFVKKIQTDKEKLFLYKTREGTFYHFREYHGETWETTRDIVQKLQVSVLILSFVKILNTEWGNIYAYRSSQGKIIDSLKYRGETWITTSTDLKKVVADSESFLPPFVMLHFVESKPHPYRNGEYLYLYHTADDFEMDSSVYAGKKLKLTDKYLLKKLMNHRLLHFVKEVNFRDKTMYEYYTHSGEVYHLLKYHGALFKTTRDELKSLKAIRLSR